MANSAIASAWGAARRRVNDMRAAVHSDWRPGDIFFGASRAGWATIGILGLLLGPAILVAWVLSSYLQVEVPASMSFVGNDGWCDRSVSVGVHCWGDYSSIHFATLRGTPSDPEAVYPLSTRLLRLPFFAAESLLGFRVGLLLFVIVSAICILLPVLWSVRSTPWFAKGVVLSIVGLGSAPFLILWDRGNVLALTVPFLLLAVVALIRDRPWLAVVAIVIASSAKPQLALLAVALVAARAWVPAVVAGAASVGVVVGSFFAFSSSGWAAMLEWIRSAGEWSASQSLDQDWPVNISGSRALYLVAEAIPGSGQWLPGVPDSVFTLLVFALFGITTLAIAAAGRSMPPFASAIAMLAIACLASPLSYAYYGVFALVVVAIMIRDGFVGWPTKRPLGKILIVSLIAALVLSLTPLVVPLGGTVVPETGPPRVVVSLLPILGTGAWLIFLAAVAAWSITELRNRFRVKRGNVDPTFDGHLRAARATVDSHTGV